jgi:hypothetical protein
VHSGRSVTLCGCLCGCAFCSDGLNPLLVNDAVVADDKSLHARDSIFCRPRKQLQLRICEARFLIASVLDCRYWQNYQATAKAEPSQVLSFSF